MNHRGCLVLLRKRTAGALAVCAIAAACHGRPERNPSALLSKADTSERLADALEMRYSQNGKRKSSTDTDLKEIADSLTQARNLYREVLSMPGGAQVLLSIPGKYPRSVVAAERLPLVERRLAALSGYADYANRHLQVRNVGRGSPSDGTEAFYLVFGEIVNGGDRVLERVDVMVYLLDGDGRPVFEKPVTITPERPIRPGYVIPFRVSVLGDGPARWDKARAEITGFSESRE